MLIELTQSQLMALKDLVADYLLKPDHIEVFIDIAGGETGQPVETRPEEILTALVMQDPV
jgi:hypothetical protein